MGLGHFAAPHAQYTHRLRRNFGNQIFNAVHTQGSRLSPDKIIGHALSDKPAEDIAQPNSMASILTRRERDIAELVSQGMSNRDIAAALVIAQRTAEGHVENILRKLGFTSRSQIASTWTEYRTGRTR
jgi:DNA-binding NarL/FixJ family response regulator